MNWIVVSFYTIGTGYEQEVKKLEASLLRFNLPYKFYFYNPTGTWRGNLNYKSATVLKAMDEFPERDIVFLDADAIVRRYPVLFDNLSKKHEFDIAACFFKYRPQSGDPDELLSGTLWIRNDERGRKIVERWHEIGLKQPGKRHQMCLKYAIAELSHNGFNAKVFRLPFEYTRIFDYYQPKSGPSVIEHFQASRRLRKQVGFGVSLIPGKTRKSISTTDLELLRGSMMMNRRRIP